MRRITALLSALALVIAGLVMTAGPSTATAEPVVEGLPDGGSVLVQTGLSGGAGRITTVLKDGAGSDLPAETQDVSAGTCDALEPGVVSLGAGPNESDQACYGKRGFGVNEDSTGLNRAERRYLVPNVQGAEELTISVAAEGVTFFGDISLDIEAFDAASGPDIELTTYFEGDLVETIPVDLTNRVVRWPPNYREDVTLTEPADQITFSAIGNTKFQLEGDTNNRRGSSFSLARVPTIPVDGAVTLDDPSGGVGTLVNQTDAPIPYVTEACDVAEEDVASEACINFKLLGDEFQRLTVYVSIPIDDSGDQAAWEGQIDFDGNGTGSGFETGLLGAGAGCTIDEAVLEQQACITEFIFPDAKDGSGNPSLAGDESDVVYRTDVWDLWVVDPNMR